MNIGIPKETRPGERRVACTPGEVGALRELGHRVLVERGAGDAAGFSDSDYEQAGAAQAADAREVWRQAELICKVHPPSPDEAEWLGDGKTLISFFWPVQHPKLLAQLAAQGAHVLAMDAVPRISRAQKLDALSSMAHVAGYRAVLEAGQHYGRFFTGQITAAGKIPPARVLVIGAGVAGLSAVGAAAGLGAVVRAFDTRPEVREQVQSMNAEFLEINVREESGGGGGYARVMSEEYIKAEMELFAAQARESDIIITTALVPGKPAPKLITEAMVQSMPGGGVLVDLAAEQGGNCELTEPGKAVVRHGIHIVGYTDFPSRMAAQSSELYAANIRHLIAELTPARDGVLVADMNDRVIRATTVAHRGAVTWPPPEPEPPKATAPAPAPAEEPEPPAPAKKSSRARGFAIFAGLAVGVAAVLAMGAVAPPSFMRHFIVFVLACFVGWQVVWNVTPALHTPLMSVTNAISSIIVIGALLQAGSADWRWLALGALLLASVNIAGGFLVTQRMLRMFQK